MWVHVFPQVNMSVVGIVIVQSLLCILVFGGFCGLGWRDVGGTKVG